MIELTSREVFGWEAAIRGMRNPMNSHDKSDSSFIDIFENFFSGQLCPLKTAYIGPEDLKLMKKLAEAGSEHAKYRRMITVYVDILAPLYWWKEFDTYKIGTVVNSCSTMHSVHKKKFEMGDFSCEHLLDNDFNQYCGDPTPYGFMMRIVSVLNAYRAKYLETKDKRYWWQMIQLLPSSYNQKRTVMMNYEVLANVYHQRKNHKLDEWVKFCEWIEKLPFSEIITG